MKIFLPLLGLTLFILLYFTTFSKIDHRLAFNFGEKKSEILIFDGYEGGYLFFTNSKQQAVVLEVTNIKVLNNIDLINGDFVGTKLNVDYEEIELEDESSSTGIIETVEIVK